MVVRLLICSDFFAVGSCVLQLCVSNYIISFVNMIKIKLVSEKNSPKTNKLLSGTAVSLVWVLSNLTFVNEYVIMSIGNCLVRVSTGLVVR